MRATLSIVIKQTLHPSLANGNGHTQTERSADVCSRLLAHVPDQYRMRFKILLEILIQPHPTCAGL